MLCSHSSFMCLYSADTVLPTKIRLPVRGNPQGLKAQIFLREKLTVNEFNVELGVAAFLAFIFAEEWMWDLSTHVICKKCKENQEERRGTNGLQEKLLLGVVCSYQNIYSVLQLISGLLSVKFLVPGMGCLQNCK